MLELIVDAKVMHQNQTLHFGELFFREIGQELKLIIHKNHLQSLMDDRK